MAVGTLSWINGLYKEFNPENICEVGNETNWYFLQDVYFSCAYKLNASIYGSNKIINKNS